MAGVKSCPRRNAGVPALLLSVLSVSCVVSPVSGSSTAVCSSMFVGGDCVNTRSSCTADASGDCATSSGDLDPSVFYDPSYADNPRSCPSSLLSSRTPSHAMARALTVILYPVGRHKKYSLYVSWKTSYDSNTNGFYVWTYKCSGRCPFYNETSPRDYNLPFHNTGKYECLPIQNVNSRSVLFNGATHRTGLLQCKDGKLYPPPRCNSSAIMTVVVIPHPRPHNVTFFDYLQTSSVMIRWTNLDNCWATAYNANCSSPVFIRPVMDFNATTTAPSGNLVNIHVTWLPSTGDVEYIVTVTDPVISAVPSCTSPGVNPPCFVARDTTHVTISMLNASKEYSVSVQLVPKCNGSSFAEHYVGCRSEDCCRAKRVRHIPSSALRPPSPAPTTSAFQTPTMHAASSPKSVTTSSATTKVGSSNIIKISSDSWTRYLQPTTSSLTLVATVLSTTNIPTSDNTASHNKTGSDGKSDRGLSGTAPVIAVTVTIALLVAVFVCSVVSIYYFVRRKNRCKDSVASASSLTDSLESSMEGGRYCNMITIDRVGEPPSYAVTCNGAGADVQCVSSLESGGRESQTTFEIESLSVGTGSTCSEKVDGSLSLEQDDAFETEDKTEENDGSDKGVGGVCKTVECVQQKEKNGKPIERRNRSESVCVKTRTSSKRRPRSSSTPNALQTDPLPSALVLYSKRSSEGVLKVIQQCLVSDLTRYNIRTISEDTCVLRKCPASWLEMQMREVSAVFCVCNQAFDHEWENKTDGLSGLVPVFKQLCHGLVAPSSGRNQLLRDKIAIVLPQNSDLQYVPTYINSRPKFRLLDEDLERMARFVIGLPEYQCNMDH